MTGIYFYCFFAHEGLQLLLFPTAAYDGEQSEFLSCVNAVHRLQLLETPPGRKMYNLNTNEHFPFVLSRAFSHSLCAVLVPPPHS